MQSAFWECGSHGLNGEDALAMYQMPSALFLETDGGESEQVRLRGVLYDPDACPLIRTRCV